jgi:ribosomal protein L16 Arg81 hydroxylase
VKCFDDLLAPLDGARFLREHWGRTSLVVRGASDKFAALPGLAELPSVLAGKLSAESWRAGYSQVANASFIDQHGELRELDAPPGMWGDFYNAGVSLCFGPMNQLSPALTALVQSFKPSTAMAGRVKTTCYLTPPSSGSAMHFDRQNVFMMQVDGEKHWTFGKRSAFPAAPLSIPTALLEAPDVKPLGILPPAETDLEQVVLRPGDVLYLPPGAWHEGRTTDHHSLHYTLTFDPCTPFTLLDSFLRDRLLSTALLRTDLRYNAQTGGASTEALITQALDDVRAALARATPADLARTYESASSAVSGPLRMFLNPML